MNETRKCGRCGVEQVSEEQTLCMECIMKQLRARGEWLRQKATVVRYYDPVRNWRRIEPHLPVAEPVLVRDFNRFTFGRWRKPFTVGHYPAQFESCDWRWERRGRHPRFWRYVKHSACHWLVNHGLVLAQSVMPERPWRIVTSDRHSTVWDGDATLFDLNFVALQVPASEAW